MSRPHSHRSVARSLAGLALFSAIALGPIAASAMSFTAGTARIGPPPMGHTFPYVNNLGGGLNGHVHYLDRRGGGPELPNSFVECYRRAYLKLEKLDPGAGYEFISATARHLCGA